MHPLTSFGDHSPHNRFVVTLSLYGLHIPLRPGNPVLCYYCGNCTAHPYHHQTVLGDKIVVRTGLLKDCKALPVAVEIFGKDRLSWQPEIASKTFSGPPE